MQHEPCETSNELEKWNIKINLEAMHNRKIYNFENSGGDSNVIPEFEVRG